MPKIGVLNSIKWLLLGDLAPKALRQGWRPRPTMIRARLPHGAIDIAGAQGIPIIFTAVAVRAGPTYELAALSLLFGIVISR